MVKAYRQHAEATDRHTRALQSQSELIRLFTEATCLLVQAHSPHLAPESQIIREAASNINFPQFPVEPPGDVPMTEATSAREVTVSDPYLSCGVAAEQPGQSENPGHGSSSTSS